MSHRRDWFDITMLALAGAILLMYGYMVVGVRALK